MRQSRYLLRHQAWLSISYCVLGASIGERVDKQIQAKADTLSDSDADAN